MATETGGGFRGIELMDDRYTVEQGLFFSRSYEATDAAGNVVLTTKEKRFSIKERFPFKDASGTDVFEVVSSSALDFDRQRDYVIVDAQTDGEVVVLDSQFSIGSQKWSLRDPDTGDLVATIESQNKLAAIAKSRLGALGSLVPYKYDIEAPDGGLIGTIEGRLSLNDTYDIELREGYDGPREAIVATAMIIDAVEEN
jgi:uncharacterized protein YxjI